MSVDINWETLTGGPDGEALAETIRDFIHERFQALPLPKLIRSITVHNFEFGKIPPEIVLKDIGDPLPDFYDTEEDDATTNDSHNGESKEPQQQGVRHSTTRDLRGAAGSRRQSELDILDRSSTSNLTRGTTPGLLGTTSNLGYFHLPMSAGLSGTQTPLAAVAGAHFPTLAHPDHPQHHHSQSFSSVSPNSTATPASSLGHGYFENGADSTAVDDQDVPLQPLDEDQPERSPEDLQVVFHATYAGDVRLSLTADVFLDYPMPSFVGIPLKLRITGFTFNGIGLLAYIKKRAHLSFLNPEDAEALVGGESSMPALEEDTDANSNVAQKASRVGMLLEDIKIESEMGETDTGRQVLKNVGKIEKFILEQVQRIFEDEFVYPSFWTFLV
jgi:distribution and morphology protein 12